MYLKTDKELYSASRFKFGRLIMILIMIGAGIYVGYRAVGFINQDPIQVTIPTPMPTATPSPDFYVAEAEGAYWDGRLTDAIFAYQQALALEPNQTGMYVALARLYVFNGQAERGLEMAREAVKRQPENAGAWAIWGLAYDWLNMPEEAVTYCEKAVSLDPTLPEAYAYLAEAYMDSGQWFAANGAIATALELDDQNVDVLRGDGYVLENQGNYYGAIQAYQQALAVHDKLAYLYLAVGRNAVVLGNFTMALEAYVDATHVDPKSAIAYDQQGWIELLLGEYDKAKISLSTALEINPFFGDAYGHLGTLYFQQVNYEDAIANLEPAITNGEAFSRRRTVRFLITVEEPSRIEDEPSGTHIAYVDFVHPQAFDLPLRGDFYASIDDTKLEGTMRLDVLSGRYALTLNGIPPVPAGNVYIGWFIPLQAPNGKTVHTDPLYPTPGGRLEIEGFTGNVKSQPIEIYYILALSYYFLDECEKAMPYLNIAMAIDPTDENTLKTLELCR